MSETCPLWYNAMLLLAAEGDFCIVETE